MFSSAPSSLAVGPVRLRDGGVALCLQPAANFFARLSTRLERDKVAGGHLAERVLAESRRISQVLFVTPQRARKHFNTVFLNDQMLPVSV